MFIDVFFCKICVLCNHEKCPKQTNKKKLDFFFIIGRLILLRNRKFEQNEQKYMKNPKLSMGKLSSQNKHVNLQT